MMTTHDYKVLFPKPGDLSPEQLTDLAQLVNDVYRVGEGALFHPGLERTGVTDLQDLINRGELLCLFVEGVLLGCAHLSAYGDAFKFGMLSVDARLQGQGYGKRLVAFMENHVRFLGGKSMFLELLEPRGYVHAHKKFLRDWYERLGYVALHQGPFPAPDLLATDCTFTYFKKVL